MKDELVAEAIIDCRNSFSKARTPQQTRGRLYGTLPDGLGLRVGPMTRLLMLLVRINASQVHAVVQVGTGT